MKTTFDKLGLSSLTLDALRNKGFKQPTPIQAQTIPLLLRGDIDVIGKAQTGTGKTAAFSLPIIDNIVEGANYVQAIVLCPTRELALQVGKEIESLSNNRDIRTLAVYGGSSIREQISALKSGVQIVVGTPGRVKDLLTRGKLQLKFVSFAVLDEADEMLNMGFLDDIEEILGKTGSEKRMLFFSATMPKEILRVAKKFMGKYEVVEVASKSNTSDNVEQLYYDIKGKDRIRAIKRIIDLTPEFHGIIFCNTRRFVDQLTQELNHDGYSASGLHGGHLTRRA